MREPEEVAAMRRLHELGWGAKRIAHELGVSKNTDKRYLHQRGWVGYRSTSGEGALGQPAALLRAQALAQGLSLPAPTASLLVETPTPVRPNGPWIWV